MVTIETTISFSTYKAVIDKVLGDTFMDGVYTPENEDVSTRVAMLNAFAPDFEMSNDSDVMWEQAYSDEANEILDELYKNRQYIALQREIDKAIQHRLRMVENGSMSLTDYALSKLVETFNEKIEKLDITDKGVKAIEEAVNNINKDKFESNLVDVFLEKGLLDKEVSAKPNRATRRANGQTSKSKTTKKSKKEPIKLDVEETKD